MFSEDDISAEYKVCMASSKVIEGEFSYINGTVLWNAREIADGCDSIEDGSCALINYFDNEDNYKEFCECYKIAEDDDIEDVLFEE